MGLSLYAADTARAAEASSALAAASFRLTAMPFALGRWLLEELPVARESVEMPR